MRKFITLTFFKAALFCAGRSNVLCIAYLDDVIKFIHKYFQKKFHSKQNFPDTENITQGELYSNEQLSNIVLAIEKLKEAKKIFSYIIPAGKDSPYVMNISDAEKMIYNYFLQNKKEKFVRQSETEILLGYQKLNEAKRLLIENL